MSHKTERYSLWILAAIVFVSFYAALGAMPLFDLDEGAFGEATREMLANGNFITTYLNGDLRFDKPILIYWLQALSVTLFGLNEFALRLPSAIAATIWAVAIYRFTKKYYDARIAFYAVLFMAGSLQITVIAKAAIADALLNMCIALTLFYLYDYLHTDDKKKLYLASFATALGMLTKGPVAILIPFATLFLFLASKKEFKRFFATVFNPVALLIFVAVASPWYILEYLDQGERFIEGFFLKHNLSRFKGPLEGHSGSLFYYIPVVLIGLLPFTSILIYTLGKLRTFFADDLQRYLLLWGGFVFLFFSFSGTKLPHYVIYGYTPLFILMAIQIDRIRGGWRLHLPTILLFALLSALPYLAPFIAQHTHDVFAKVLLSHADETFGVAYKSYMLFALSLLLYLSFSKRLSLRIQLVSASLILLVGVNFFAAPSYAKLAQQPIKEAALFAKKHRLDVVMYGLNTPSFSLYREALTPRRAPKPGEVAFMKTSDLASLSRPYETLYKKFGYTLIKVAP